MKKLLALALGLFAGSLAFAQSEINIIIDPNIPLDRAGLVLKRAEAALDRARARLEGTSLRIIWISPDKPEDPGFMPFQFSWAPGLAIPFGYYDVGLSLAAIGALTRDVQGMAGAGVFNLTRDVQGMAAAGVFNISRDVEGAQLGGVFNIADGVQGTQVAGVFNIAGAKVEGAQIAGVFNIGGDVEGLQAAGVFDIAGDFTGPLQAAGLFTIAETVEGSQVAGLFNVAGRVRGAQIAPLVNVATRVQGVQVGLVNVATRIDGVQLGLINIAGNGVGGVGVLYEGNSDYEWAYWQNGTPWLYTVFMAGLPYGDLGTSADRLLVSAGAGSRFYFGRSYLDLEVAAVGDVGSASSGLIRELAALPMGMQMMTSVPAAFGRCWELLPSRPWPALRATIGIPLLWRLHLVAGARVDLDFDDWPALPERMKTGIAATGQNLFGLGFSSYTKWYLGFRI